MDCIPLLSRYVALRRRRDAEGSRPATAVAASDGIPAASNGTPTAPAAALTYFDLLFRQERDDAVVPWAPQPERSGSGAAGHNDSVASAECRIDTRGAAVETTGQD